MEAVLGVVSLSAALGPLSPTMLSKIHTLVRRCILVATTAATTYSTVLVGKKSQAEQKGTQREREEGRVLQGKETGTGEGERGVT